MSLRLADSHAHLDLEELAPEQDETFVLDSKDEAALLAALAEADRGETISDEELLNRLRGGV